MTDLPSNFCVAPWVHLHVNPTGKINPCCGADYEERFTDYAHGLTVQEMLNVPSLKQLRRDFENNERPEICKRCYEHEDQGRDGNSLRTFFNKTFMNDKTLDAIESTNDDGYLERPAIQYLDIRFGNICNLKCRMCGHELSSTWYEEMLTMRPDSKDKKFIHIDMYDELMPYLADVEEIYFAGGEPLLYPEHVKMLQELIRIGNTNVRLKYNTNLMNLKYKKHDILELWSKFSEVNIGASIDGAGRVIEYMRTGSNWDTIVENFRRVHDASDNIQIYVSPTIGALNVEMLPEFHKTLYEEKMIGTEKTLGDMFLTNYVVYPKYQNIRYLPKNYKTFITKKFQNHIEWINENVRDPEPVAKRWYEIISFLNVDIGDNSKEMRILRGQLDNWDRLNPGVLDWKNDLPHLVHWFS